MSETLKKLSEKFAPRQAPELLAELCDYWDTQMVFFAGSFEVDHDEYESVKDWFQGMERGYTKVKIWAG
jgi:hypothetical protein